MLQQPFWATGTLCRALSIATLILFGAMNLMAQSPPVTVTMIPSSFEDGDTVAMALAIGTYDSQVSNALEIEFEIECDGFTIDPASIIDALIAQYSFFADDNNWDYEYELRDGNATLWFRIFRTDNDPRSGWGYTVTVTDIIITIDVIQRRAAGPSATGTALLPEGPNHPLAMTMTGGYIELDVTSPVTVLSASLMTMEGRQVTLSVGKSLPVRIPVSSLKPGLYVLVLQTSEGRIQRKVVLGD